MGAQIVDVVGDLVTCKVWGTLTQTELAAIQLDASGIMQARGSIRLLVIVESFQGWERGEWENYSFQAQHDAKIESMAVVGDQRWEELTEAFVGKGLREFPIEYFAPSELGQALRWLAREANSP
jgi:hypothetical protein